MNRIQEIRIAHQHPFKRSWVEIVRQTFDATYSRPSRFSLNRLEEIINALADRGEGRLELRLYPSRIEVVYALPVDYYDGPLELSDLLG